VIALAGEKATHPIWPLNGDDGRLHRSYPLAGILNHRMEFLFLTRRAACAACGLCSSVGGGIRRRKVVYLTQSLDSSCPDHRVSDHPTRMRERNTVETGFIESSWQRNEDSRSPKTKDFTALRMVFGRAQIFLYVCNFEQSNVLLLFTLLEGTCGSCVCPHGRSDYGVICLVLNAVRPIRRNCLVRQCYISVA
jgi:hypothetical protein